MGGEVKTPKLQGYGIEPDTYSGELVEIVEIPGGDRSCEPLPPPPSPSDFADAHADYIERLKGFNS